MQHLRLVLTCAAPLGDATPQVRTDYLEGHLKKFCQKNDAAREIVSVIILLRVKILKDTLINWTNLKLPLYETFLLVGTHTHWSRRLG